MHLQEVRGEWGKKKGRVRSTPPEEVGLGVERGGSGIVQGALRKEVGVCGWMRWEGKGRRCASKKGTGYIPHVWS